MKKVPSIRMPDPKAGVIRSDHPRAVGMNGLVESHNWILRDGSVQVRDGVKPVVTCDSTPSAPNSIIALVSHDYQGQDENGDQGTIRDQLIAVLDSDIICYDNDLGTATAVSQEHVDWAWDGAYGWVADTNEEWALSPKISIDWSNIDWGEFTANIHGIAIQLRFGFYNSSGITLEMVEFTDSGTSAVSSYEWAITGDTLLDSGIYEQGVAYEINIGASSSGIYIIFNDSWASWYNEAAATGDYITGVDMPYYWACYHTEESGPPGDQDEVLELDRTYRPVTRTWDYEQTTHTLVATKEKFLIDVDSDSLNSTPAPTASISGNAGECPRAKTIGIAGQRIVAGHVSYYDSKQTMINNETIINKDPFSTSQWHNVVDSFAFFPDAVVYSGTVLTGGHLSWYPGDILRLADTPGEIMAIQEMGTQMLAVYKTDSIYTLTSQTGVSPFAPSLRASGIQGPVSTRSVVALNDSTHIYLARDGGLYMFSGQTPQSLGDQFRSWVARELDPEYADRSFVLFDPERNEIHAYYPVKGSAGVVRKGLVIDVSTQPFTAWPVLWPKQVYNEAEDTLEDWNITCATMHFEGSQDVKTADITIPASEVEASPKTKYQELYFGTENEPLASPRTGVDAGRIFKTADIWFDHGVAIDASMESGISDLGDPDGQKVLLEIELLFDNISDVDGSSPELDITIYGGDSNKDITQLYKEEDISMSSGQILVHPRVRARYFSYKIDIKPPANADWDTGYGEIEFYGAIARFKQSGYRQN